jgi:hypothetical protein
MESRFCDKDLYLSCHMNTGEEARIRRKVIQRLESVASQGTYLVMEFAKSNCCTDDDKTTWRIGVLVWPKTVCNHHYKTVARVWLLV